MSDNIATNNNYTNNNKIMIEELMKNNPFNSINNMLILNRCWLCELPFQRGTMKHVFQISDLLSYYHQLYSLSLQNDDDDDDDDDDDNDTKNDNDVKNESGGVYYVNDIKNDDNYVKNDSVASNDNTTIKDDNKFDINDSNNFNNKNNHPDFISNNLKQCYQYYITMLQLSSNNLQQQYQYHNTTNKDDNNNNNSNKAFYLLQSFDNHQIQIWMSGLICKTNSNCQQEMIYFIKSKPSSSASSGSSSNSNNGSSRIGNHIFQPISMINNSKNCLPGCGCDNPWPFLSS